MRATKCENSLKKEVVSKKNLLKEMLSSANNSRHFGVREFRRERVDIVAVVIFSDSQGHFEI